MGNEVIRIELVVGKDRSLPSVVLLPQVQEGRETVRAV
jgi:hypothetical protein